MLNVMIKTNVRKEIDNVHVKLINVGKYFYEKKMGFFKKGFKKRIHK